MKWTLPFKKTDREREPATSLRLRHIRFRNILEHTRSIFDLLDDGRDKMEGEYILDGHYVDSLADRALEYASKIAYEACLLDPRGGKAHYERFDEVGGRARRLLTEGMHPAPPPEGSSLDPEYRLLSSILDWLDGPGEREATLLGFARSAIDRVVAGWEPPKDAAGLPVRLFECAGLKIRLVDTDRILIPHAGESGGRLVRALFTEAEEKDADDGGPAGTGQGWFAVSEGSHLSLRREGAGSLLRIEARLSGFPESNFVFVYAGGDIDLKNSLVSSGRRVERNETRSMGWLYGLEPALFNEGLNLLCRHLCGQAV